MDINVRVIKGARLHYMPDMKTQAENLAGKLRKLGLAVFLEEITEDYRSLRLSLEFYPHEYKGIKDYSSRIIVISQHEGDHPLWKQTITGTHQYIPEDFED